MKTEGENQENKTLQKPRKKDFSRRRYKIMSKQYVTGDYNS